MFKRGKEAKDGDAGKSRGTLRGARGASTSAGDETFVRLGLNALPPTLDLTKVTALSLDDNALTGAELVPLFASPTLRTLSAKNNRIIKVPPSLAATKKLSVLELQGNPLAWPVSAAKAMEVTKVSAWRDHLAAVGKRIFRMYKAADADATQLPYVDIEVSLMADPMYPDKDEDRGIVLLGAPHARDGHVSVPMHDLAKKNRFGDPDELQSPWYRVPVEHHVLPATYLYAGVFDGHGGNWVSSALRQYLHVRLAEAKLMSDEAFESADAEVERYKTVYAELDQRLLEKLKEGSGTSRDGSTAVSCVMTTKRLTVSHVGDSRVVLGYSDGRIEQVTRDHEPNEEPEKSGVIARGGTVAWHDTPSGGGVWRVNGDLCMSRSFGDPRCKPAVCCVPDVSVRVPVPELDTIIISSDGLFHHVSSEEAVKIVRRHSNCEKAAVELYKELRSRIRAGKNKTFGIDNTMIGVVKLTHGSHAASLGKLTSPL